MRRRLQFLFILLLALSCLSAHARERWLFLGDSITQGGHYTDYIETWLLLNEADAPEIINLGLSSETVSGLTEPGHPFPRPYLHTRLDRVLEQTQPDLVIACYGMNCGIYHPFSEERFAAYQAGIEKLVSDAQAIGAKVILLTPPPYAGRVKAHNAPAEAESYGPTRFGADYNEVLGRYAEWILSLGDGNGVRAFDIRPRIEQFMEKCYPREPVHPNKVGHELMAEAFLQALGKESGSALLETGIPDRAGDPQWNQMLGLVNQQRGVYDRAWLNTMGHGNPRVLASKTLPLAEAVAAGEALNAKISDVLDNDLRMAWWRERRFGMFIHWGAYSVLEGEWQGKPQPGYAEWIQRKAQIPQEEYEPVAARFNPTHFDADAWIRTARDAGMKYFVITTKHHDGFCLWDSAYTQYDIKDHAGLQVDPLAELSRACKKYGLRFGTYYSILDWKVQTLSGRIADAEMSKQDYVRYMKGQIRELIEKYDTDILWFDGDWVGWWTVEDGADLYAYIRGLKPGIIINNRVSKRKVFKKDFGTPEQATPGAALGYDWEACWTINHSWGFKKHDTNWKSTGDLLHQLIDITSKGGNLLLNVGPRPDGAFPEACTERLLDMGQWLKRNGEAVYGTDVSVVPQPGWGRITQRGQTLYLHVFDWPKDGTLLIPGLKTRVTAASLLAGGTALEATAGEDSVRINVPGTAPDPIASVIKLHIEGPLELEKGRALTPTPGPATDASWPGSKSDFHGFVQYDFKLQDVGCRVVVPQEAAEGAPWIWRAQFWGHQPQADIALLKSGFHLAYVQVGNSMGSPGAVAQWDRMYTFLTEEHGLSRKAALEGMSRGGLLIYNWAARNPEKVACIYADNPVCDFKSWPGGQGVGDGSERDWEHCQKAYGMTEAEALAYEGNPVDNLAPLASADIPLLHVVGDADKVVPVSENTAVIEKRYQELGGRIEVIHKEGSGHHPHSLKDPTPIVEFIRKHTQQEKAR